MQLEPCNWPCKIVLGENASLYLINYDTFTQGLSCVLAKTQIQGVFLRLCNRK